MPIRGVHKIVVPVADQARAHRFWTEVVGFTTKTDVPYDDLGNRWIEVASADGATALILSPDPDNARFEGGPELPTSQFFFYADNIVATHAELSANGVDFPAPPEEQPWGWWSMFTDSEGNRFALQQR